MREFLDGNALSNQPTPGSFATSASEIGRAEGSASRPLTFWIDLENIPCVTFFAPIIHQLRHFGHRVHITYRSWPEMADLLRIYSLSGQALGTFGGKHRIRKVQKGLFRALRLGLWAREKEVDLAIGFGARPLALCCRLLKIPSATVIDYEHVSLDPLKRFCDWIFVPEAVGSEFWEATGVPAPKLVRFQGLKEDVYACRHTFDASLRTGLGISPDRTVAVIRPPAHIAHYHDPRSEAILRVILEQVGARPGVLALLIPRVRGQRDKSLPQSANVQYIHAAVNGLDLVGLADLVISGGGTMVREAAALGIPAYSCFTGPLGAIDAQLAREGRLVLIRDPADASHITFRRKGQAPRHLLGSSAVLDFFVDAFIRLGSTRALVEDNFTANSFAE